MPAGGKGGGALQHSDLLLKGGTIIDGQQTRRYAGDLAVAQGRIAAIGSISPSEYTRFNVYVKVKEGRLEDFRGIARDGSAWLKQAHPDIVSYECFFLIRTP